MVVAISTLITIMFAQIIRRAFLGQAIVWADGLARYLLIWSTFLGATIAAKENSHVSLSLVEDKLNERAKLMFQCAMMFLFGVLACFVLYAGILAFEFTIPQRADALPISIAWIYAAIPFSQVIIIVHLISNISGRITAFVHGEGEAGGEIRAEDNEGGAV